ncbi:COF family HAD hydrolase protein [Metamycoplasma cloacale]|uniref:Haloacid dehalogenase n=1 Tax=Metamycoplasma cloacale TaxID=92401 RepID=A0A2Z4LNS1_9BACT|nr:HAD hydrolase family protein [Metamycoplasma cloacale]AWX42998.1 haloacid dehalogenase [Metamycoplasma cloacale]VEU79700.1 COF family HAD hydrolase protein [Metamycoplasma cloacale]
MNFKPQAYFLDLDGTTLDLPKTSSMISSENVDTIRSFNDNNIPVIISTGRGNSEFVMKLAKSFNSPYVICQNGGLIVDKQNNLLQINKIKQERVADIVKLLIEHKLCFILNSSQVIYGPTLKIKMIRPWAKKMQLKTYDDLPKLEESTKILTFGVSKKKIVELRDLLASKFIDISQHIVSRGYSIEITDINATKGKADAFVCKLLNVDPKYAAHVGDSGNDTTSKEYVGAFICMKNGLKNVRVQATIVGPHYKKAGVAKVLRDTQK